MGKEMERREVVTVTGMGALSGGRLFVFQVWASAP